jgi:hypothetical protein
VTSKWCILPPPPAGSCFTVLMWKKGFYIQVVDI